MLPDSNDVPSLGSQLRVCLAVPLYVAIKFPLPPVTVGLWGEPMVRATMPEAAVHHYRKPDAGEHDVGPATPTTQQGDIHAIAQATPM